MSFKRKVPQKLFPQLQALNAWLRELLLHITIAFGYFFGAKLGIFIASEISFVSVIWPPAGLALAAVVLYGYRVCPAIYIGCLYANFTLAGTSGLELLESMTLAGLIALGCVFQAILGKILITRFVQAPKQLESSRDIINFQVLGGPVSCLLNASFGIVLLWSYGLVTGSQFFYNWLFWWIGDVIGVLTFTPLFVILFSDASLSTARRRISVFLPSALIFGLVLLLFKFAETAEVRSKNERFNQQATLISNNIEQNLTSLLKHLKTIEGQYTSVSSFNDDQFKRYASYLRKDTVGVHALEWIPFSSNQAHKGFADFQHIPMDSKAALIDSSQNSGDAAAHEFNFALESHSQEALEHARLIREFAASQPFQLSKKSNRYVVLAYPIYQKEYDNPLASAQEKSIEITAEANAFFVTLLDIKSVMESVLRQSSHHGLEIDLFEANSEGPAKFLYSSNDTNETPSKQSELANLEDKTITNNIYQKRITFAQRIWILQLKPNQQYLALDKDQIWSLWFILIGGLLFTSLFSAFALLVSSHAAVIQRLVDQRTEELNQNKKFFESIVEDQSEFICRYTPDTTLTFVNKAYANFFGYETTNMLGKKWLNHVVDEDVAVIFDKLKSMTPDAHSTEHICHSCNQAGERRTLMWLHHAFFNDTGEIDSFQSVGMDVTEKHLAEKKLLASEQELKTSNDFLNLVLEATEDGIWDIDFIIKQAFYSPRISEMLGYEPISTSQNIEKLWKQYIVPEDMRRLARAFVEHVRKGVPFSPIVRCQHKDGSLKWIICRGKAQFDKENKLIRMVGSTTDITALKNAQEKAEEATRLKSEFLANMSHEIRTPLNGVIGMANLLLESAFNEKQKDYTQLILSSAKNLLYLLNDILDFSKIEADKLQLEETPINLFAIVDEVQNLMSVLAQEKGIELIVNYIPNLKHHFLGDPGRIRQVFINLIHNALKFTETGHIFVNIHPTPKDEKYTKISVEIEDTGIGISEEMQTVIFDKFSQADGSTTRKFEGSGLGLTICKKLIEFMQGHIGVRSTLGLGSTFWFDLILENDPNANLTSKVELCQATNNPQILIVEDNLRTSETYTSILEKQGVTCTTITSTEEALSLLEQNNASLFHAIVTKHALTGINGLELAKTIRKNPNFKETPLLILTPSRKFQNKDLLLELGVNGFISKPVSPIVLLKAVDQLLWQASGQIPKAFITEEIFKQPNQAQIPKNHIKSIFKDIRVLLVEDNLVNQKIATLIFKKFKCQITPAVNGREAVNLINQASFDIIFMDCQMPEMDGFEATRMIREKEEKNATQRTPIIALTANALKKNAECCFQAGMDDFMTKPINPEGIEMMLQKWLRKTDALGGLNSNLEFQSASKDTLVLNAEP